MISKNKVIDLAAAIRDFPDRFLAALDSVLDRRGRHRLRNGPLAILLLAPALTFLGFFGVAPLFYAVYMSFFRIRGGQSDFLAWGNYGEALGGGAFWNSFSVTFYYALGTVPITLLLSFIVANGLFRIARMRGTFRTLYFLPYVTSVVAAAMIWRVLLEPRIGVANQFLSLVGIPAQQWLLEPRGILHILTNGFIPHTIGPSLSLCCVMLFEIWHSSGFMIVLLLAGLTAIPRELEDAARIDGANWFQVARNVTLPLLSPTVFFLAIVSVIKSFQAFSSFYALTGTGRGPLDTTQNLTVYVYTNFYEYQRLGYGAAVATLLCLTIVTLTLVQWRLVGRRVYYQ